MAITYEILASTTVNANQATITLSSISQSYTDLRLVANMGLGGQGDISVRCNGDTGNNYYSEVLTGLGTAGAPTSAIEGAGVGAFKVTSSAQQINQGSGGNSLLTFDFLSYTFSLNKPVLWEYGFAAGNSSYNVRRTGCGNYTSGAPISSITIFTNQSFSNGTTFALFGILKA